MCLRCKKGKCSVLFTNVWREITWFWPWPWALSHAHTLSLHRLFSSSKALSEVFCLCVWHQGFFLLLHWRIYHPDHHCWHPVYPYPNTWRGKKKKTLDLFPKLLSLFYLELQLDNLPILCDLNLHPPFLVEAKGQFFTHEPHLKITYVTLIHFIIFHKLSFSHILK